MDNMIKEAILSVLPVPEQYWHKVEPLISVSKIPAKILLLQEGEVSNRLYFIVQGALRLFFIKEDGAEYTSQFFFENQIVASVESFLERQPSRAFLETLEESIVCIIKFHNLTEIISLHEDLQKWYLAYLKNRLIYYTKSHSSFILDSPEKRYLKLIEDQPFILERVPHYYIASYLGVTPVSLSRIRKRIKNKGINKG